MRLRGVLIATVAGLVLLSAVAMSWPVQAPRTFPNDQSGGHVLRIGTDSPVHSMTP